jgi:hypothetical protein
VVNERREFRASRTRVQHGILLSVVLALIGLGTLLFAGPSVRDAELVGAAALAMSAVMLALAWRNARDTRARMVLDTDGIWFRDWEIGPVPWAAIGDAYTSGSRLQAFVSLHLRDPEGFLAGLAFVSLHLRDPEGFLAGLPEAERKALGANRLARMPELRIAHGALDAPLDEVLTAIEAHLGGASGNREG